MARILTSASIKVEAFQSGFANNAYLVTCPRTNSALIVDAPDAPTELINCIAERQIAIENILITHEHWDHIEGLAVLAENFSVPFRASSHLAPAVAQHSARFAPLADGATVDLGELQLTALTTPGHTPGSMCYFWAGDDDTPPLLFAGDTLFPGGPGKTDSRADFCTLIKSLETQIFTLPQNTLILPGHGASIILEQSLREYEVFKQNTTGTEFGQVTWL